MIIRVIGVIGIIRVIRVIIRVIRVIRITDLIHVSRVHVWISKHVEHSINCSPCFGTTKTPLTTLGSRHWTHYHRRELLCWIDIWSQFKQCIRRGDGLSPRYTSLLFQPASACLQCKALRNSWDLSFGTLCCCNNNPNNPSWGSYPAPPWACRWTRGLSTRKHTRCILLPNLGPRRNSTTISRSKRNHATSLQTLDQSHPLTLTILTVLWPAFVNIFNDYLVCS